MSFRELTMIDVKEVLRRWQAGQSGRQMAREGVVGRRTVARYIEAAKELGVTHDAELTDELVRAVAGRVQERPAPDPSDIRANARPVILPRFWRHPGKRVEAQGVSHGGQSPHELACMRFWALA